MITYKFRIYPTVSQQNSLKDTIETCRRLYNYAVADRIQNHTSFYDQEKALVERKKQNKSLKAVHSQVLLDTLFRVDKSFKAFYTRLSKFPRFKRYGRYNSFSYPQSGFRLDGKRLRLSKIGNVKLVLHRKVSGVIKRVTLIRDIDQWFVAFTTDVTPTLPNSPDKSVGVDSGLLNVIALSDGTLVENSHTLKQSIDKIKTLQRDLSRKRKGSRNRVRARIALAKAWRKVRRQRDDFSHKVSSKLAVENNIIVFEDLKIHNMVKNHNLASAIMDATWGKLRRLTAYKAERRGGRVILVNPSGTSQKCSGCEWLSPTKLTLKERMFHCMNCGLTLDRDINASRNILKVGLERSLAETEPLPVTRRISKFQSRKQEAPEFIHGLFTNS
jgi:putative transposase